MKPIVIEIGRLVPPSAPHVEDAHRVDELKDSLRELGLRVPLVVRPTALGLEIVDGLLRYQAARALGWGLIPVIVEELNDRAAARHRLALNAVRRTVSALVEARLVRLLLDQGEGPDRVAAALGRSRTWLRGRLQLLEDLRLSPVDTAEEATRYHEAWREGDAEEVHTQTGETPRARWERILGNVRLPSADELLWAFRGELTRTVSELGVIQHGGQSYEAPASHRRAQPYRAQIRFDLLDASQVWIEDDDGSLHACPLHRVRSHTERRERRRKKAKRSSLSFNSLFEEGDAPSREGEDASST